jgi:hypothetical protein
MYWIGTLTNKDAEIRAASGKNVPTLYEKRALTRAGIRHFLVGRAA